jgi:hypothetical protein
VDFGSKFSSIAHLQLIDPFFSISKVPSLILKKILHLKRFQRPASLFVISTSNTRQNGQAQVTQSIPIRGSQYQQSRRQEEESKNPRTKARTGETA